MDYLWIYILIILIFVVRGVIKSAEQQRKNSQNMSRPRQTETESEEVSPFDELSGILTALKTDEADKIPDTQTYTAAERNPSETKKRLTPRREEPSRNEEERGGYFADAEEVRKAIIASEILNRKY